MKDITPRKIMLTLKEKYFLLTIFETWFSYRYTFNLTDFLYPIAFLHIRNADKRPPGIKKISYTVENSLESNLDVIYSEFAKNIRTAVKKAEEEGISTYFHNDLDGFVAFYNAFASKKGISLTSKKRLLELDGNLK
jgi:hypothetical protein